MGSWGGRRSVLLGIVLVGTPVPVKVGADRETFSTIVAGIGPLPRVHSLMSFEVRLLGEGLAARGAGEGAFASVHALVLSQVGAAVEPFATGCAWIGLITSVDLLVFGQNGVLPEATATLSTLMWSLWCGQTVTLPTPTQILLPTRSAYSWLIHHSMPIFCFLRGLPFLLVFCWPSRWLQHFSIQVVLSIAGFFLI